MSPLQGYYPREALTPPSLPTQLLAVFFLVFSSELQNTSRVGEAVTPVTFRKQSRHENISLPRRTPNFINTTPTDANTLELIRFSHPAERKYRPSSLHYDPSGASSATLPPPIPISAPLASVHTLCTINRHPGESPGQGDTFILVMVLSHGFLTTVTGNKDQSLLFKEGRWKGKRSKWDGSLNQPRGQSWIREPPPSGESGAAQLSDALKELILSLSHEKGNGYCEMVFRAGAI